MKKEKYPHIFAAAALLLPLLLFLGHVFAKETQKIAYITFDDGPTLNTPEIVKTLEKYNAKATFFVLEERIRLYPDFIKQIDRGGNTLGLHGVSHSESIYASPLSPLEEMQKTDASLKKLLGRGSRLVRVPFGSGYRLTKEQAQNLYAQGYIIWDWNVDPRDSVGKINEEKVMDNLKKGLLLCEGDPVILLHDRKTTRLLLPRILAYLKEEGYAMLPLSEKLSPVTMNFH